MKKIQIGIDIDDVISESCAAVLAKFNTLFGTKVVIEQMTEYYKFEQFLEDRHMEQFKEFDAIFTEEFIVSYEPDIEAKKIITAWSKKGYGIHYITARPTTDETITKRWLKQHGFLVKGATLDLRPPSFAEDANYKYSVALKYGIDVMIDDHIEYVRTMQIPVLLLNRPWNQGELPGHVRRVSGWKEVEAFIVKHQLNDPF